MGSDTEGPALVLWYPPHRGYSTFLKSHAGKLPALEARYSFIDADTLRVLKVAAITLGTRASV